MKKPYSTLCAACAALVWLSAQTASAMDHRLDPSHGAITLKEAFAPDPYKVSIRAGGDLRAGDFVEGCMGFVARAPDLRLFYRPGPRGRFPLTFFVSSSTDTTLVINAPNGRWYCDDDGNGGHDPKIRFDSADYGQYDVWVGVFSRESGVPATLSISEW